MNRARSARPTHRTRAWLLRRVEHGESDLVLTLFTESLGRVSALARSARRSQKRFGGVLEPFHTLALSLEDSMSGDLMHLHEASLATPRLALTANLDRMDAAGKALGWVRSAAPPRVPEPAVWQVMTTLLDRLDAAGPVNARLALASEGLALLAAFGWGLELERCVRCGKACAQGRAALIDAARGGLVCRSCGGARLRLDGRARARIASRSLLPEDVDIALDLAERALLSHAGVG